MPKVALPIVHRALRFAAKAHRKQERDGDAPLPYLTHPVELLSILRYQAGVIDAEVLAAAVLHDVLEETDHTSADIEKKFGARVASLVNELTRKAGEVTGLSPEEERQVRTQAMIGEIDSMSADAKLIKLADRTSNLAAARVTRTGEDLARYVSQTKLILAHIDRKVSPKLWDGLDRMVADATGSRSNGTSAAPKSAKKKPAVAEPKRKS